MQLPETGHTINIDGMYEEALERMEQEDDATVESHYVCDCKALHFMDWVLTAKLRFECAQWTAVKIRSS